MDFHWHHTSLRVKDVAVSVAFYERHFGMRKVYQQTFDSGFSLTFLASPREGEQFWENDQAGEKALWDYQGTMLELVHNRGTESDPSFTANNGNVEPHRGFGHIAVHVSDLVKKCEELEAAGVKFQKKLNEGRMHTLAFALDPDGYWVEIMARSDAANVAIPEANNLSQTMIRVKDAEKSLAFYRDVLGLTLVRTLHMSDFSLYFMAELEKGQIAPDPEDTEQSREFVKRMWRPCLELTHNHGTETQEGFSYHNGNTEPKGFGHTAFAVPDLAAACRYMDEKGVPFEKRPEEGTMREIAFVHDPDGYWVELVQKGVNIMNRKAA